MTSWSHIVRSQKSSKMGFEEFQRALTDLSAKLHPHMDSMDAFAEVLLTHAAPFGRRCVSEIQRTDGAGVVFQLPEGQAVRLSPAELTGTLCVCFMCSPGPPSLPPLHSLR